MNNMRRIFLNPLVIIVPLVVAGLFFWQRYTSAVQPINSSAANILPNAGFDDELDAQGLPNGWQLDASTPNVSYTTEPGYESFRLLSLHAAAASAGNNSTLTSPKALVKTGDSYLFKGYYKSTLGFDLLVKQTNEDGTSQLSFIRHYSPSDTWTTMSDTFKVTTPIQAVQYVYSFVDQGNLQLDNLYLEQNASDIVTVSPPQVVKSLQPNPKLVTTDKIPDKWNSFNSGTNQADFSVITSEGTPHLDARLSNYTNGEAKWQYEPAAVHPGQYIQFGVTYKSDRPVDIIAEYILSSGERQFVTLGTLTASKQWLSLTKSLEVPPASTSLSISLVIRGNGTVSTKAYSLDDISKSGVPYWQQPYVSLTFDDGWVSDYSNVADLLNTYRYKGTFYLNPSTIDTAGVMSSEQVSSLESRGHELASHGYEHLNLTALNKQSIQYQLEHAHSYFTQVHDKKTINFASPYGASDAQTAYYVRKFYASQRGTEDGINTRQSFDPYNLKVLYVGNDTPISKLVDSLKQAKQTNGWLILVYHQVTPTGTDATTITPQQFKQQLDTISQNSVAVQPVGDVIQKLGSQ